jgi:hypothetical protein
MEQGNYLEWVVSSAQEYEAEYNANIKGIFRSEECESELHALQGWALDGISEEV